MVAVGQPLDRFARCTASIVTGLSDAQSEIAAILFGETPPHGFVLAGGFALAAHGAVERDTRDIDAFVQAIPTQPPGDVTALAPSLSDRLESVEVDLAVDSPLLFPTESVHGRRVAVLARGRDVGS